MCEVLLGVQGVAGEVCCGAFCCVDVRSVVFGLGVVCVVTVVVVESCC